jgi:DNA-binding NarL/FixJ family response regulator
MMLRVLVVDDQPLIRSALKSLLGLEEDMEVIAEAADGKEACRISAELKPDVILMDISMPVLNGIEATKQILQGDHNHRPKVIMLTTFEEDRLIKDSLNAGARGFLGKTANADEIATAIRKVAGGEKVLSQSSMDKVLRSYATPSEETQKRRLDLVLTAREIEVLRLVANGLGNQEIAEQLFISSLTVKTHIRKLMTKLEVHDRSQLVIEAYEGGIVAPGGPS